MDTKHQKEMKQSRDTRASTNSDISALRSAIQKNKQVGLDIIKKKADKQKAAKAAAKAAAEAIAAENDLEKWEIQGLKKKLRDVNLENAKNIDRSTLKYPLLYNTREEIMEIMRKDSASINYKGRMDILNLLDHIFHNTKLSYNLEVGRLEYIWYEDPESGDPFDAVYGIHYDGYIETEEDYGDESSPNLYLRISGTGDVVEEYIDDDWLQLSMRHDKLGYVTIHAK